MFFCNLTIRLKKIIFLETVNWNFYIYKEASAYI